MPGGVTGKAREGLPMSISKRTSASLSVLALKAVEAEFSLSYDLSTYYGGSRFHAGYAGCDGSVMFWLAEVSRALT